MQHYNGNQNILGHLPWKEAEAVDDLFTIPTVKLSGRCISGRIYSSADTQSRCYSKRVTDILISVSANRLHHLNIQECLETHGIDYEVYLEWPEWYSITLQPVNT